MADIKKKINSRGSKIIKDTCHGPIGWVVDVEFSSSLLFSRWPLFVLASSSVVPGFWSTSPPFRSVGTRSFDATACALLLSSFSPSPVPFLASSSRRIVLQSGSRRRVVVVGFAVICSASTEPTKMTSSLLYPGGLGPHTGRDPTIKKPSWAAASTAGGEIGQVEGEHHHIEAQHRL